MTCFADERDANCIFAFARGFAYKENVTGKVATKEDHLLTSLAQIAGCTTDFAVVKKSS
jgi:hypothetical protein